MTVHYLDTIGMRCPLPIIKMARLASTLPIGDNIVVTASDPAAEYDIAAWARMKEHLCSSPTFGDDPWSVTFKITLC